MDHIRTEYKHGQVEPSDTGSSWAANPVLVLHNGKVRFWVDLRRLNKVSAMRTRQHGRYVINCLAVEVLFRP